MYNRPVNDRIYDKIRDFWLPALILATGCLLSVVGHQALLEDRKERLVGASEASLETTEVAVRDRLDAQMSALEGLANLWARFGMRPFEEWRADVDLLIDHRNGLSVVAWVDLDEPQRRIAVGDDRPMEEFEIDVAEARRSYPEPRMLGPERSASGELRYRVFLPVRALNEHAGVLLAHVELEELLAPLLSARATGYAVEIRWQDETIFSRGTPADPAITRWWRAESTIDLPMGGQWQIIHQPTANLAQRRLNLIPHYLLAASMVAWVLLAMVVHYWRGAARQARFLGVVNRTLEERGEGLEAIRLELERRVAERTGKLEEAVAELESFNHSVSHDLRSPLGAVLNFAAILEEDYQGRALDADGMEILSRIRGSAERATELLEGLLQLSRTGQAALDVTQVDLTQLAEEIAAEVRAAANLSANEREVRFDVSPLPTVAGDRELLGTVFANLFGNAIKYARKEGPTEIRVTGEVRDGECIVEVEDNGQGFDMRFAERLFGLFERLHHDESIEGTGLGLALVARIVTRHGGRVWAHGEPEKGARFSFALPVDPVGGK